MELPNLKALLEFQYSLTDVIRLSRGTAKKKKKLKKKIEGPLIHYIFVLSHFWIRAWTRSIMIWCDNIYEKIPEPKQKRDLILSRKPTNQTGLYCLRAHTLCVGKSNNTVLKARKTTMYLRIGESPLPFLK